MEYGLRHPLIKQMILSDSLNPCCNGIWSQTGALVICCSVVL